MIPRWRKWLCLASTLVWPGFGQAGLTPVEVPLASDLRHEGAQAERDCVPLLLEFSAYGCEYCSLLEEEILKPMLRNRDYDRRVVMRKLVLGRDIKLDSFSGNRLTPAQLASHYNVVVTPTLLFVDSDGRELSERMVGINTLDFYGGYLDQALDSSRERLREDARCR